MIFHCCDFRVILFLFHYRALEVTLLFLLIVAGNDAFQLCLLGIRFSAELHQLNYIASFVFSSLCLCEHVPRS